MSLEQVRPAPQHDVLVVAPPVSSADLFVSYRGKIRRYILGMVRDPTEADDLTQDVFLQAHRKLDSVRDPDALVSWLYRIATHLSYDRFRQSSRRPKTEPLDPGGSVTPRSDAEHTDEPRLDRVVEQKEMSACVREYMESLSDDYRQVILLHDLEGLSNPEIAGMLGATVDTVKIRLHRARGRLHAALSAGCDFSHDEEGVLVCEPSAGPAAAPPDPSSSFGCASAPSPKRSGCGEPCE